MHSMLERVPFHRDLPRFATCLELPNVTLAANAGASRVSFRSWEWRDMQEKRSDARSGSVTIGTPAQVTECWVIQ